MDKQPFIERMLELENLTDELEDEEASWLLEWGTSQMESVLAGIEDSETAGNRANALMAVMRKINRIAGSYKDKDPHSLAVELADLGLLCQQAFGPAGGQAQIKPAALDEAAQKLARLTTQQALEFLTRWYFENPPI